MNKINVLLSAIMLCFVTAVSMAAASPEHLDQTCHKDADCPWTGMYCDTSMLPNVCKKCVSKGNPCVTDDSCCPLHKCMGPENKKTCEKI